MRTIVVDMQSCFYACFLMWPIPSSNLLSSCNCSNTFWSSWLNQRRRAGSQKNHREKMLQSSPFFSVSSFPLLNASINYRWLWQRDNPQSHRNYHSNHSKVCCPHDVVIIVQGPLQKRDHSGSIPLVHSSFVAQQYHLKVSSVTDLRIKADKHQSGCQYHY